MIGKRYAIGEQDFKKIITGDGIYIDKTQFIIKLLERWQFFFLSRPRRFGKSLFVSTLENFFLGRRELFKGLAIDSYPWDWETYPVVRIDLSEGDFSRPEGLEERLFEIISEIEEEHNISPSGNTPRARMRNLLRKMAEIYQKNVVILIDEYEKPLLDTIFEPHFDTYKSQLHDFYSVFKNNSSIIRFLFITGVTRFGHLNIFSGLNNLVDISLKDDFAAICGFTEEEMRANISKGIEYFGEKQHLDFDQAIEKLKYYYDGYHFSKSLVDIYNPFSLLDSLSEGNLSTNWFQSGSSSFLVELIKEKNYDLGNIEGIEVTELRLMTINSTLSDPIPLLYQSGYLTIKSYSPELETYTLGYPNYEVKKGVLEILIPLYLGQPAN